MKMRLMPVCAAILAVTAVTSSPGQVERLAAQAERTECRCVDADGNEIENCSCFRTPQIEGLLSRYGMAQQRPRLGVSVDQGQPARFDADGALVTEILGDGPADLAGIRDGDVIVSLNGQSLTESIGADRERSFDLDGSAPVQRLLALARDLEPGQDVEIEYLRDGTRERTTLEAEDLSDRWGSTTVTARPMWDAERFRAQMRSLTDGMRRRGFHSDAPDHDVRLHLEGRERGEARVLGGDGFLYGFGGGLARQHGLELVELNPGLGAYFGTDSGVLVIDVDASSELGLQQGDVILRIGDRMVETPDRVRRIVSSYGFDEEIDFLVLRNGDEITVTGRLDD